MKGNMKSTLQITVNKSRNSFVVVCAFPKFVINVPRGDWKLVVYTK